MLVYMYMNISQSRPPTFKDSNRVLNIKTTEASLDSFCCKALFQNLEAGNLHIYLLHILCIKNAIPSADVSCLSRKLETFSS